jgi:purine-binding chemotaxis protein CheW
MTELDTSARAVLLERARQLARPLAGAEQSDALDEKATTILVARLGDERVGIPLDYIIEVYVASEVTPIPGARAPVVGVIAWRGRVLSVLDIAHTRREPIATTDATRILVLGQRGASFAIVADDVEGVQDVAAHEAMPVEDISPARRELVRGVTPDGLVVLNAAALIARFAPTQHSTGTRE